LSHTILRPNQIAVAKPNTDFNATENFGNTRAPFVSLLKCEDIDHLTVDVWIGVKADLDVKASERIKRVG
jgi:hypothetical protein